MEYDLGNIENKIYILNGSCDCLATPEACDLLCKKLKNCEKIIIPKFGHGAFSWSKDMSYFKKVLEILRKKEEVVK